MMDTSELMTEFAVRMAVMGKTEPNSGTNSFLGLENLPPRRKNINMPAEKEKMYEPSTANAARFAPSNTSVAPVIRITPRKIITTSSKSSMTLYGKKSLFPQNTPLRTE